MDCPPKKNCRCREVAVSGDSTVVYNRKEGPYLVLYTVLGQFVVTPFDYKDENSFRFSLRVHVRFKLCNVVYYSVWIRR